MNSNSNPTIIVPARLASVRFPKKLLADAGGKPLIIRTADRIKQQVPEIDLFFAVDGYELKEVLESFGYKTIVTDPDLPSGTDRIAVANKVLKRNIVINVQADEPMVHRSHILQLLNALKQDGVSISTLATPFKTVEDFLDPNQVKVVQNNFGNALYFSRAPIPQSRGGEIETMSLNLKFCLKHMGLYGYKKEFLNNFINSQESILEKIEKLEQLRALQLGFLIAVEITDRSSLGVDVPEDLKKLNLY